MTIDFFKGAASILFYFCHLHRQDQEVKPTVSIRQNYFTQSVKNMLCYTEQGDDGVGGGRDDGVGGGGDDTTIPIPV